MKVFKYFFMVLACCNYYTTPIGANNVEEDNFTIQVIRATNKITINGSLDDLEWNSAHVAKDFWQKSPTVKSGASPKSEVRLLYDDKYLYVGIICYDTTDKVIQSLKPDKDYFEGDGFGIVLDPMNKKTNGFIFGINPLGALTDGLISNSTDMLDFNWNNKWHGESKIYEDKWTAEMAIPFSTLRFDPVNKVWGINFVRNAININQYHTWTEVPQQYYGIDLGYTGTLIWDELPTTSNKNITLIPYISGLSSKDYQNDLNDNKINAGFDAKIGLTKSLNLDLTINPDFSQVDIDEQVTNLTRFDIFLPEKRTFFLENSDLFNSFGIPPLRPFFSRTIGLDENDQTVPIQYGLRLTGNINDKTRIGLMNIMASANSEQNELHNNYTAASVSRSLFKRSSIKFLLTNRQKLDDFEVQKEDFGRNIGGEFSYVSQSGDYSVWLMGFKSFKPKKYDENIFYSSGFKISKEKFSYLQDFFGVGAGFYADMGYINRIVRTDEVNDITYRIGYHLAYSDIKYNIFPNKKSVIHQHTLGLENISVINFDGTYNDRTTTLNYDLRLANSSSLKAKITNYQPKPLFPFFFTDDEDFEALPAMEYMFSDFQLEYNSDHRKNISYSSEVQYGGFYNGDKLTLKADLKYRWQPWVNLGIGLEHNDLVFPDRYGDVKINVISTKFEINFNKNLFWTSFLQYIDQSNEFNINSRIQWRFAPFSDLFLVYTDNYSSTGLFIGKADHYAQALVLKINYWWNP